MKKQFLQEVIGAVGLEALSKAGAMSKVSEDLIFARTLLSWISVRGRYGYNDLVPGSQNHLRLKKNGDGYTGVLTLPTQTIPFANDSLEKVAAWVSVTLGTTQPLGKTTFNALPKLGQSIDLLVKTHYLSTNLKKGRPSTKPQIGTVAKPIEPIPPIAPEAVQPKNVLNKQEKPVKLNSLKLKTTDFKAKCSTCGTPLFKDMCYRGCFCLGTDTAKVVAKGKDLFLEPTGSQDEWTAVVSNF